MPIKVLAVHNRYLVRGGEDESHDAEVQLLHTMGHNVVEYVEDNRQSPRLDNVNTALRSVWSTDSYRIVRQKIQATHPDIVQVQNFFPLISPSIYYAARAEGVPVVQTIHNYRLLCLNGLYYRDDHVCEDCRGRLGYLAGIRHACYRHDRRASASVALMLTLHWLLHTWEQTVSAFVATTEFAKQKLIAGGLPLGRIFIRPNFVSPTPPVGNGRGQYALYVGRLSSEKGLQTLLAAWSKTPMPLKLVIVGDGPLSEQVHQAARHHPTIEYMGRQPPERVLALMREASFLVFPSGCYENMPRVIVEAFACGTPVIASRLGAMPELITSGQTGLHFRAGEADDLRSQVNWMLSHPAELHQMRQAARAEFEARYTAERNYQRAIEIYETVIASARVK